MYFSRAVRGLSCSLALCSLLSCGGSDGAGIDPEAVATVTVSPPSSSIDIDQTVQLTATARNSAGDPVSATMSWSSNPTGIVTIGTSGLVTAVSEGSTTITATAEGRSGTATVEVTDPFPPGAPSGIQAAPISDTRIDVSWVDNSHNEDEFVIEREAVGAGPAPGATSGAAVFAEVGSVGADETTFEDNAVDPATTYRYRVVACNGNGCSDASDHSAHTVTHETLVIQTPALPDGVTGLLYEATLVAVGGTGDAAWSLSEGNLPPGLTLAPLTGVVSGDPTTPGTFEFTVQAVGAGQTVARELSIFISDVPLPPIVTTMELPSAGVDAPYGATLEASQGDGTFTWAMSAGALPDGMDLDPIGEITGVPTADGTFAFTVEVTSAEMTDDAELAITVQAALEVSATELPTGVEGQSYEASLSSEGGDGTGTWSLESGSLPEGLTLTDDGTISGTLSAAVATPSEPGIAAVVGTSDFTVKVQNSLGQTAIGVLSITVHPVLDITTTTLPDGQVDAAYSHVLVATGGDGAHTWSVAGGSLPAGLALDANTGEISGSPENSGTFDVTIQANSGDGQTAQEVLAITIDPAPVSITTSSLPDGEAGTPYNQQLMASGGTGVFTWAVTAGDLPDGLVLNENTGGISGTPSATGTFDFTVEASSGGQMDDQALSITIAAAPLTLDNYILAGAFPGVPYSDFFVASGGDGTYTFAHTAGTLPDGLSVDGATGELSGTAGASGAYYFTIQVTSDGTTVSRTYALAISTQAAAGFNLVIANAADNTIPSAAVIAGLSQALATWETVIVGDLGDWAYGSADIPPGYCSGEGLNGRTVDDIVIMVRLSVIDGPGNVLGSAGPCDARVFAMPINFATLFGRLTLDTSDLAALDAHQMKSLFFHEIGHIVGLGTIWRLFDDVGGTNLISDAIEDGGTAPKYEGAGGNGVYTGALGGGSSGMATKIPIETEGGLGTQDSHWEEAEFDNEVMTGWAEASGTMMPISEMTIAAVGDFRYTVNTGAAEAFAIPGCAPTCAPAPPPPGGFGAPAIGDRLLDDIHDEDLRGILPDGTIVVFPRRSDP